MAFRGAWMPFLVVAACGDPTSSPSSPGDATSSTTAAIADRGTASGTDGRSSTGDETTDGTGATSTGADVVAWSGPLRVMTFNVLCSFCDASYAPWPERVPWIGDTIDRHAPDLVGLQELVTAAEVDEVLAVAPEFSAIYFGEEEAAYPDATILYRRDQLEPVQQGWYWLSPTPDVPYSTGFIDGVQFPRVVGWAVLRRPTDDAHLYFATTHFDNNPPSQELSAPLSLQRLAPFADQMPVVFVGDYNSPPGSPAFDILTAEGALTDAFELAAEWSVRTNLPRRPAYDTGQRIDHIFVGGAEWSASSWVVDQWTYGTDAGFISDHFAIVADLSLD